MAIVPIFGVKNNGDARVAFIRVIKKREFNTIQFRTPFRIFPPMDIRMHLVSNGTVVATCNAWLVVVRWVNEVLRKGRNPSDISIGDIQIVAPVMRIRPV